MRFVSSRLQRGVAALAVFALLCLPLTAFADMPIIGPPIPGAAAQQPEPPSLWEMCLVWIEIAAKIGPPTG
jgi:hypothetical protein